LFISAQISLLHAQNNWASTYTLFNKAANLNAAQQTIDGGFILTGNIDVGGSYDLWLLKLDPSGIIVWQKTYGGDLDDYGFAIEQTNDEGFIVSGQTLSFGAGSNDAWIVKFDKNGNIEWQKSLGQNQTDYAISVKQTSDGFIVAGATYPSSVPPRDFWVIKFDPSGNVVWQKSYGGTGDESATSVNVTSDGGFIVFGYTDFFGAGLYDLWVLKLDSTGTIQWQKTYGTSIDEYPARGAQETTDGGFVIAGTTSDRANPNPNGDVVVLKLDSTGQIQWQKSYGTNAADGANSIEQTADGGYIVGGETTTIGDRAFWLLRLDFGGKIIWQKAYRGNNSEVLQTLNQTSDGGFIASGTDPKRPTSKGTWIIRVADNGEIDPSCTFVTDTFALAANSTLTELSTTASAVNTTLIPSSTTATVNTGAAQYAQQCVNTCIFCDDFGDGVLATDWTYLKQSWSESGGDLIGSPVRMKAESIARPAFVGCDVCSIHATMKSSGGMGNKISLITHYVDKKNNIEVILSEEADKVVVKQRLNGRIFSKAKSSFTIDPNTSYDVHLSYDGSLLTLSINGTAVLSLSPVGNLPAATVGFKSVNTDAFFGDIRVD
jgi:hypothetical protein